MDNRKKKKNKHKNKQNSGTNSQRTTIQKEIVKQETEKQETKKQENIQQQNSKADTKKKPNEDIQELEKKREIIDNKAETIEEGMSADAASKTDNEKAATVKTDESGGRETKKENHLDIMEFLPDNIRIMAVKAAKILLPAAACVIIIAVIVSYAVSRKNSEVENTAANISSDEGALLSDKPLEENIYSDVNELMSKFYTALSDGDIDTVKSLKDYNSDKEIITYEKKSEFIEYYDNINCYTKPGIDEGSYFVYVTYTVKIQDIETKAPGLNAWYVYTAGDGSLRIDGDTEENIKAAFKLVTSQDDVVDLYNKIDVSYKEAVASDESLHAFMDELPVHIKTSVGEALAQLETQDESSEASQSEVQTTPEQQTQAGETETSSEPEELPQNQVVNQIVRATDTVNVRSSDSEEADRIGKVQAGTELTRIEDRVNGWSKVVFEDREAYIKSDYLEVVTTEATAEPIGTVTALTNVNVRSQASQESAKLGTAQAGSSYDMLSDLGEWFKISYNGNVGYVKAEFFEK